MAWIWINPRSEPEEMVEAADRVVRNPNDMGIDENIEEHSDSDVGFEIAKLYNQAESIGVYPVQTEKDSKAYFSR